MRAFRGAQRNWRLGRWQRENNRAIACGALALSDDLMLLLVFYDLAATYPVPHKARREQ